MDGAGVVEFAEFARRDEFLARGRRAGRSRRVGRRRGVGFGVSPRARSIASAQEPAMALFVVVVPLSGRRTAVAPETCRLLCRQMLQRRRGQRGSSSLEAWSLAIGDVEFVGGGVEGGDIDVAGGDELDGVGHGGVVGEVVLGDLTTFRWLMRIFSFRIPELVTRTPTRCKLTSYRNEPLSGESSYF